jgi:REP element-mobilizing transposase RayT
MRAVPQSFYRRNLPHLQRDDKAHFVTFCTYHRWVLPEWARTLVLRSCCRAEQYTIDLYVAVVMPDHAHMIFSPRVDPERQEMFSLARIMKAIKGTSSHWINQELSERRRVWQEESFDHVIRSSENLDQKIAYVLDNPVRKGLVAKREEYPWRVGGGAISRNGETADGQVRTPAPTPDR